MSTTKSKTEDEKCEACGEKGRIKFDTQGEGTFWLCGMNDDEHLNDKYIGIIVGYCRSFRDAEVKKLEDMLRVAIDALELYTGRPFIDRPALEAIANIREMKINKEKT